ncbi:MAG: YeeE/YedE family protein [Thermoanaerobacteraceae bacterium]|nr:YeeE/YedE family protein [Thermoanaerobacteraceae bacterium]
MKRKILTLLLLVTFIIILVIAWEHGSSLYWAAGVLLGFILHRCRFCFAAAFRDLIMFRDGSVTRAVIISLAISTVGFALLQYYSGLTGSDVPGNIEAVGVNTMAGAFLFGIGMVIAGCCACSFLMRLGEGFILFLFVLIGMLPGSLLGLLHRQWWESIWSHPPVYFPDYLGWGITVVVQLLTLMGLYLIVRRWEKTERGI